MSDARVWAAVCGSIVFFGFTFEWCFLASVDRLGLVEVLTRFLCKSSLRSGSYPYEGGDGRG